MLKNYLKTALRHFSRQKGYTFINMFGLTIGLACCLVIFLYVTDEMSYDKYHDNLDRIYRIAGRTESPNLISTSATVSAPVAQVLSDHFPQVEKVAKTLRLSGGLVERGTNKFYEDTRIFSDAEIFDILDIPFLLGEAKESFDRPGTIVLSERMAKKYFDGENPIGQTLLINSRDYEVTGVVADSPQNTHFKYNTFVSMKTLEGQYPFDRWFLSNFHVYIKLQPQVIASDLEESLAGIAETYAPKELMRSDETNTYFLQPVEDIHLLSHLRNETEPSMNPLYLYILSAIGIFVLLIACMNFINLSTARSTKRAKEVGVRKVIGANRSQLVRQFLSESLVIIVIALILAMFLVSLIFPLVNSSSGKTFTESDLMRPSLLIFLFTLVLFVSIAASAYPALFLSSFQPLKALKENVQSGLKGSTLRRVLVVSQFAISIALIAGTLIMYRQINFMKNQYLGFDKEQKLIIPVRGTLSLEDNYETVKASFMENPSVTGTAVSSHVIGQRLGRWDTELAGEGETESRVLNHLYVGPDFIKEYGIQLVAGRIFSREFSTDKEQAMIINRKAASEYGWSPEDALGQELNSIVSGKVIGVIEDFHYQGLQTEIEPLALFWKSPSFEVLTLSLNTAKLDKTLAFAKTKWEETFPGYPFEYSFLDAAFDMEYQSEDKIGKMFFAFTLIGILIACLGLFGLASFTAEKKTKEIGVRKVLGATVAEIVVLLSKEIFRWVLLANLIAWPVVYLVMNIWLKNFAYRVNVSVGILTASALIALAIALVTTSYQSIKAACANPVDALKYE
ncbi:MAG: ABC transporter permease [Candidatus Aminicenantes bacterium]|nr:ABC transporter permease [Candidatus Aminicenantes bacterium]